MGIEKRRVTAYHPSANGAVERQHRRLKEAFKAKSAAASRNWLRNLPLTLLGLRNAISKDTGISAAQAVFGRQLSIPGCVFDGVFDVNDVKIRRDFERKDSNVPNALKICTHVWLRKSGSQPSMTRPYIGPFKVEHRCFETHTMIISTRDKKETVSMERIKPAWGVDDQQASPHALNTNHVTFETPC